jgi:uncharacterized RDD family membrane protein YckC
MALFERPKPQMGTEDAVVFQRIAAFVIDLVVIAVAGGLLGFALSTVSDTLAGLVTALLVFGYYIYFEGAYGQTIGKMVMDIVVVHEKGGPCTYENAAVRTVLRIIDVLPSFYLVGVIVIFLTDHSQRLGDLAADTRVVRSRERGAQL